MKGLEALKQIKSSYKYDYELQDFLKPIEKELKLFHKILNKGIGELFSLEEENGDGKKGFYIIDNEYNRSIKISKEEFDLLGEIL